MKIIEKSKHFAVSNKSFIIIFAVASLISIFFPPSADDLGWATSLGWELFSNGFKDYNGRYFGNIFAVLFTRLPILLPIIKGFTLSALLFLVRKFSENKSQTFIVSSAFLLLIPAGLFKQSFVWTAGFSNYFFPIPIILTCIWLISRNREISGMKGFVIALLVFVSGIAGQLFMEHYTICTLCISAVMIVYYSAKKRRVDILSFVYFAACVIGAIIMFINGAYSKVLNGTSSYQSLTSSDTSSLGQTVLNGIKNLTGTVSVNLLRACFPVLIFITVFSLIILLKNTSVNKKMQKAIIALFSLAGVSLIAFPVYYIVSKNIDTAGIFVFIMLILIASACGLIVFSCMDKPSRNRILIYALLIAIQCAPLCFVFPVGPRCFCAVYILMILIVGEMQNTLCRFDSETGYSSKKLAGFFKKALIILAVIDLIGYAAVFSINAKKIKTIQSEIHNGNTCIVLKKNSFRFLVYALDTEDTNEKYKKRFCEYYGLPDDIEITFE